MQGVHLRKYGVETTIDFELYEVDGVDLRVDWVPAAVDCEVMKDEGASTQCTNTATDEGPTYSIVLTATEMQAERLVLKVVDAATKVFLDKVVMIETYGNASAQHAIDLNDSVRAGLTALPNAVADAAGGLPISDAGGLDLDTKLANTNEITVARMGALTDWINGGRLDLILDIIAADVVNIDGAAMRGTDDAALATALSTHDGKLDTVDTNLDLTLADTNELQLNQGNWLTATGFSTHSDTDVWAVATRLLTAGTNIALAKGVGVTGFNDLSAAEVNTEVDTALDTAIPGSPTAGSVNGVLDSQKRSAATIVDGAAATGTLSTTEMTTDITVSVADQYNGRILIFAIDTTTAALRGQATDITDTVVSGGKLTFTALTTAPVDGDIFSVV